MITHRDPRFILALDHLATLAEHNPVTPDTYPDLTTQDITDIAALVEAWADRRTLEARDEALEALTGGIPDEWDEGDRKQAERQDATAWDDDPHAHPDTDPHEDMLDAADHDRQEP